jgi:mannose-6-phosphate isomerase-like protein (cupin superfamily)
MNNNNNKSENIFFRPWGFYKNTEEVDGIYKVKIITVNIGQKLSLQSHNHRSEHWVIVKGKGKVQLGEKNYIVEKNQHIYIPVNELHRIENIGDELLEFTETQIGHYLGEDDIIRYQDDYGRV